MHIENDSFKCIVIEYRSAMQIPVLSEQRYILNYAIGA